MNEHDPLRIFRGMLVAALLSAPLWALAWWLC